MSFPHPEWLLLLGIVALYLYDSALLLAVNEAIITPRGRDGWRLAFGSERFPFRGREPYFPHPWLPHRPLYRLVWRFEGDAPAEASPPPPRHLGPLGWLVWLMAVALFVLLPAGLFSPLGQPLLFAALALFYGAELAALTWIWRHRGDWNCRGGRYASLVFECVTCPPFALNLVRRLSTAAHGKVGLPSARPLLDAAAWSEAVPHLITRIEGELAWEPPESPRHRALARHLDQLLKETAACPA